MGVHDILWCRSQLYDGCARVLYFSPPLLWCMLWMMLLILLVVCVLPPPTIPTLSNTHTLTRKMCVCGGGGAGEGNPEE